MFVANYDNVTSLRSPKNHIHVDTHLLSIFLKRRPIVCKIRNNKLCKEIVHSDDLLYLSAVLSLMETVGGNKRQMGFLLG